MTRSGDGFLTQARLLACFFSTYACLFASILGGRKDAYCQFILEATLSMSENVMG
jgi:hypothetical protein